METRGHETATFEESEKLHISREAAWNNHTSIRRSGMFLRRRALWATADLKRSSMSQHAKNKRMPYVNTNIRRV